MGRSGVLWTDADARADRTGVPVDEPAGLPKSEPADGLAREGSEGELADTTD